MRWTEEQLAEYQRKHGVPSRTPNTADVSAPPFACPPDPMIGGIVLDLPAPISLNRIWRKTKAGMIKSKAYDRWIERADGMLIEMGQLKGVKPIVGKFTATILVKRSNLDLDNNAKCVLDFLQSRCFIANDKHCEELTLRWGEAPTGCRVTLIPMLTINDVLRNAAERLESA